MDKQLYVATDLDGGDLLGAVWATSELEAYDYFSGREPMISEQNDRLCVEPVEKSGYTIDEIKEAFPELFEESISEDVEQPTKNVEPSIYEMAAARAMHFMLTNYNMDYQEIADELDLDLQVVLDLIGPDSYDDSDIMFEYTSESDDTDDTVRAVPEIAYVVMVDDGPNYKNVYLTFSDEVDDYTSVDSVDEIGEWDYHASVADAISRAKDAGWSDANMRIVKISNFKDAYVNGEDPEEEVVQTVELKEKLKEEYRRIVSRGKSLNENELFVDFE